MPKRPIQRKISDSKPKAPRFARPAQLARFLGCDQRTAREYCKAGLIKEAEQTAGGHWRIRLPLSTHTRLVLRKRKEPNSKVGAIVGDFDGDFAEWLMMAALGDVDWLEESLPGCLIDEDLQEDDRNSVQRKIVERLRAHEPLDDLLLAGWVLQLEREGERPSQRLIAERMGMSRDTLHRRFVRTGILAKAKRRAYASVGRDVHLVKSIREIQ